MEELSARELEVLKLIVWGYCNKEAAAKLFLSIKTIEKHRFSAYCKLRVNCTMAALRVALRNGLIQYDEWIQGKLGEDISHGDCVITPRTRKVAQPAATALKVKA